MKYELSEELINSILDYLSKQPYIQVFHLISDIHVQCNQRKLQLVESTDKGE